MASPTGRYVPPQVVPLSEPPTGTRIRSEHVPAASAIAIPPSKKSAESASDMAPPPFMATEASPAQPSTSGEETVAEGAEYARS
jgi:hypothetical protein